MLLRGRRTFGAMPAMPWSLGSPIDDWLPLPESGEQSIFFFLHKHKHQRRLLRPLRLLDIAPFLPTRPNTNEARLQSTANSRCQHAAAAVLVAVVNWISQQGFFFSFFAFFFLFFPTTTGRPWICSTTYLPRRLLVTLVTVTVVPIGYEYNTSIRCNRDRHIHTRTHTCPSNVASCSRPETRR